MPFSSAVLLHCCPILCEYCLSNDHRSRSSRIFLWAENILWLSICEHRDTDCLQEGREEVLAIDIFTISSRIHSFSRLCPLSFSTELIHSFSLFSLFFGLIPFAQFSHFLARKKARRARLFTFLHFFLSLLVGKKGGIFLVRNLSSV